MGSQPQSLLLETMFTLKLWLIVILMLVPAFSIENSLEVGQSDKFVNEIPSSFQELKSIHKRDSEAKEMQKTKKKKKKNSKKRKERISEKKKKKERGRKGKKTKGRKRRKLNLESGKENPNKNKQRQSTNNSSVGCQDIECLNKLVQVLKMNKDTVQNFIKQKKRMLARLSVIANKKKKKS